MKHKATGSKFNAIWWVIILFLLLGLMTWCWFDLQIGEINKQIHIHH